MWKIVCLASIAALAIGQRWDLGEAARSIDTIHGYKVQYEDGHDIFIFINADNCYLVEAQNDRRWDAVVHNHDLLMAFTEQVWKQMLTNTSVTSLSHDQASNDYHSRLEQYECRNKDVFLVDYQRPTASN